MQRDRLLVEEMIEAANRAIELTNDVTVDEVAADRNRLDALLWNFTVLGEAATQVSATTKGLYSYVNWANPARLRNRIVHGYWSIDLEVLHTTATEQLGKFVDDLRSVLEVIEDSDA
jgi:uncharacterized protein with HEPN domain